jgi:glycosyltransferase involved in cell wall biosynthesis
MATCPGVGFVYQPGDHRALGRGLQQLLDQPMLLEERKRAALRAAKERWNWEIESRTLVDLVQRTLFGEASRGLGGGNPPRGGAR